MKKAWNVLAWVVTLALIAAIAAVTIPRLFGVQYRAVLTGSMAPELPVGSLVAIVPTKAEDIRIGDNITFVTIGDKVVTHKVVEINGNEFTTQGVANEMVDAPNEYENILGVVRLCLPKVGYAFEFLATMRGKIIAMTTILALCIISLIVQTLTAPDKREV